MFIAIGQPLIHGFRVFIFLADIGQKQITVDFSLFHGTFSQQNERSPYRQPAAKEQDSGKVYSTKNQTGGRP
jgi:hypothetical protein